MARIAPIAAGVFLALALIPSSPSVAQGPQPTLLYVYGVLLHPGHGERLYGEYLNPGPRYYEAVTVEVRFYRAGEEVFRRVIKRTDTVIPPNETGRFATYAPDWPEYDRYDVILSAELLPENRYPVTWRVSSERWSVEGDEGRRVLQFRTTIRNLSDVSAYPNAGVVLRDSQHRFFASWTFTCKLMGKGGGSGMFPPNGWGNCETRTTISESDYSKLASVQFVVRSEETTLRRPSTPAASVTPWPTYPSTAQPKATASAPATITARATATPVPSVTSYTATTAPPISTATATGSPAPSPPPLYIPVAHTG